MKCTYGAVPYVHRHCSTHMHTQVMCPCVHTHPVSQHTNTHAYLHICTQTHTHTLCYCKLIEGRGRSIGGVAPTHSSHCHTVDLWPRQLVQRGARGIGITDYLGDHNSASPHPVEDLVASHSSITLQQERQKIVMEAQKTTDIRESTGINGGK